MAKAERKQQDIETTREELVNSHNVVLGHEEKHYAKVLADNQVLEEKISLINAKLSSLEEVEVEKSIAEANLVELKYKFSRLMEEKAEVEKKLEVMEKSLADERTRNATLVS